jgi:hypothetical protein
MQPVNYAIWHKHLSDMVLASEGSKSPCLFFFQKDGKSLLLCPNKKCTMGTVFGSFWHRTRLATSGGDFCHRCLKNVLLTLLDAPKTTRNALSINLRRVLISYLWWRHIEHVHLLWPLNIKLFESIFLTDPTITHSHLNNLYIRPVLMRKAKMELWTID